MPKRKILPYNSKLKSLARNLRNRSTLSEVLLWNQLKGRQVRGYQFLRQRPIDDYIVDFFCYDLMLAIEIDGHTHDRKKEEDAIRQKRIESLGITVLRFLDVDVKGNMEGVLRSVEASIEQIEGEGSRADSKYERHPPDPPQGGNGW